MRAWILFFIVMLGLFDPKCVLSAVARVPLRDVSPPSVAEAPYGLEPGYTDNIDDEMTSEPQEMLLIEKPDSLKGPDLHDQVFNSQLSKEFLERYQDQFGRTEMEENYFLTSRQGYYISPTGVTATQEDTQRRDFAEYMMKRLAEYHADNVMKNDPQFRAVYNVKQAVSNYNVNVGSSIRVDARYEVVGNYFNAVVANPVANMSLLVNMDPTSYFPTSPQETYLNFQRPFSRSISTEAGWFFTAKTARFVVSKAVTPAISTSVSQTLAMDGFSISPGRESLSMVGLKVVF